MQCTGLLPRFFFFFFFFFLYLGSTMFVKLQLHHLRVRFLLLQRWDLEKPVISNANPTFSGINSSINIILCCNSLCCYWVNNTCYFLCVYCNITVDTTFNPPPVTVIVEPSKLMLSISIAPNVPIFTSPVAVGLWKQVLFLLKLKFHQF